MTVYLDASVLVRIVAGQARPLSNWQSIVAPLSSALIEVEAPRAIERLRLLGELQEKEATRAAARCRTALRAFSLMEIDHAVRFRAAGPFAVLVRSLDAIHLASALLFREANPADELLVATHDERMAKTALAHGLDVIGWP